MALAVLGDTLTLQDPLEPVAAPLSVEAAPGALQAPMAGQIVEVRVAQGDRVETGQLLFVLEAMKMQLEIRAPLGGTVTSLCVEAGQVISSQGILAVLDWIPCGESGAKNGREP
jgi:biotin carboxyl carrier protein